jgi:lysophospholipase L1-like esterase
MSTKKLYNQKNDVSNNLFKFVAIMNKLLFIALMLTGSVQAQRVLVVGTSIDYGLKATHPDSGWVPRVKAALGSQVVNRALPNATYLDSTNYKLIPQLRSQKGQHFDIVILGGPTNDAQPPYKGGSKVRRAYKRVIDSVVLWFPNALIIHNTPIQSRHAIVPQITLDTLITPMVIKEGGLICNFAQLPSFILSPDRLHPNNQGYRYMANAFIQWWTQGRDNDYIKVPVGPIQHYQEFDIGGCRFWKAIKRDWGSD